jgi:hypothetical protein
MPFTIQGGRSKSLFEQPKYDGGNVEDLFLQMRQETIDLLVKSLKAKDRFVSGNLAQSIDVRYDIGDKELSFTVFTDEGGEYWKFVDKGVSGTKRKFNTPFSFRKKNLKQAAMLEFIRNRSIYELKDKSGKVIFSIRKKGKQKGSTQDRAKTMAFIIGRSLAMKGIKPTNFVSNALNEEWKQDFTKRLAKAIGKDIRVSFNGDNNK